MTAVIDEWARVVANASDALVRMLADELFFDGALTSPPDELRQRLVSGLAHRVERRAYQRETITATLVRDFRERMQSVADNYTGDARIRAWRALADSARPGLVRALAREIGADEWETEDVQVLRHRLITHAVRSTQ